MSNLLVVAWIDPEGDIRDTGRLTFDGANYFHVYEKCAKPCAIVYSHDENLLERASTYVSEKQQEFNTAKLFILPDTDDVLAVARAAIAAEQLK